MKVTVITVSDRASRGEYEDKSGPAILDVIKTEIPDTELEYEVVPDGFTSVLSALKRHIDSDWILTTGGTGPAPRDETPEATRAYITKSMPGIAEYLRMKSLEETPFAVFSRGEAGMRERQYIVNLPGSEKGARFCTKLLIPLLKHGIHMAEGGGH
ncbi:MAG TPA: MogA/MoaB family molybdenum cofactor biosynthesis protein [Spirochaetales bacterium]|nr:MogA/MoaB family molybdenum cofactor biosynthesis protein [Spirochaetales bacterium]HQG39340.1 MogA/MoaB family molybdenum cofactor biosynthesis protein [Spirochaetales bacterium]HQK34867.1 MogA/MoaB family molybdenum cofactor biosynthesis protein [Spirochaetales bacterium]